MNYVKVELDMAIKLFSFGIEIFDENKNICEELYLVTFDGVQCVVLNGEFHDLVTFDTDLFTSADYD
jgi:hypothetical protein